MTKWQRVLSAFSCIIGALVCVALSAFLGEAVFFVIALFLGFGGVMIGLGYDL